LEIFKKNATKSQLVPIFQENHQIPPNYLIIEYCFGEILCSRLQPRCGGQVGALVAKDTFFGID
jgi:hypothetical protein